MNLKENEMENKISLWCKVCNDKFTINDNWTYDGSECKHHNSEEVGT